MPTTWWRPTGRRTAPDSPRSGAWVRQPTPSSRCGWVTPTEPGCGWSPTASWEPTRRSTGNAALRFADRDLDDVDRLRGLAVAAGGAGRLRLRLDRLHDVDPARHVPDDRILRTLALRRERRVRRRAGDHKELASRGAGRLARALGHGDGADRVRGGLRWHIHRLVTGSAGTVALGVAALDHEALYGSVEGQAVEEVVPRQEHDAAHRVRRKLLVELEDERATGRLDRRRVGGAGLEDVLGWVLVHGFLLSGGGGHGLGAGGLAAGRLRGRGASQERVPAHVAQKDDDRQADHQGSSPLARVALALGAATGGELGQVPFSGSLVRHERPKTSRSNRLRTGLRFDVLVQMEQVARSYVRLTSTSRS